MGAWGFCKRPLCKHLFCLSPVVDTGLRQNRCLHCTVVFCQNPRYLCGWCWTAGHLRYLASHCCGHVEWNEWINALFCIFHSLFLSFSFAHPPWQNPKIFIADHHIQCTPLNKAMFKKATLGNAIQSLWNGFFYIPLCTKNSCLKSHPSSTGFCKYNPLKWLSRAKFANLARLV